MISFVNKHKVLLAKLLIVIGYGISIPGLWMMRHNPTVFQLSWVFTTLTLLLVLLFHKPFTLKFAAALIAVGVIGWVAEAIGTNTGVVFGDYTYGASLGVKIIGTPFAMLINWIISVYLITMILRPKISNIWRLGFAGAFLMVIYDILLEPVAVRLGMWSWGTTTTPPLQNYIAWYIISFPLIMLLARYVKKSQNPLVVLAFVSQLVFFTLLNLMIVFLEM
ncbi:MAG: carotenoid biosynthesis protein [Bacteroidales bacterium]|nr:carotenoid biosynthesis protein [Tenuifilaceae bacterium]